MHHQGGTAEGDDGEALEYFRGNPQARFAVGTTTDYAIAMEFEAIVQKYPNSVYAPWSYYFLGNAWQRRAQSQPLQGGLPTSGALKNCAQKAADTYQRLLEKHPDFPLAVEVRHRIAKEEIRLGNREKGLADIAQLTEKHPNLALLERVQKAIEGLEGHNITDQAFAANLP